jgi:hypothetical protein
LAAVTEQDEGKKWNMKHEQLVDFKRTNGHCMVPQRSYEQDESLGNWVTTQRSNHEHNELRQDRKTILDEIRSLGKTTTGSGTSGVKSWSNLNETKAIAWCHKTTSKTSLLGSGLGCSHHGTVQLASRHP